MRKLWQLVGQDAGDWLRRVSTASIQQLQDHQILEAFFLSPQGKIQSVFTVCKQSSTDFLIDLECNPQDPKSSETKFLEWLDRYHFREQMELKAMPWSEWREGLLDFKLPFLASLSAESQAMLSKPLSKVLFNEGDGAIFHLGSQKYGVPAYRLWFAPNAQKSFPLPPSSEELALEWRRLGCFYPKVGFEIGVDTVNPLEVHLEHCFSESKGCYPGQEVIEKVLSKGDPARRLLSLEGLGKSPILGATLFYLGEAMGTLSSVAQSDESSSQSNWRALALVSKRFLNANVQELSWGDQNPVQNVITRPFRQIRA